MLERDLSGQACDVIGHEDQYSILDRIDLGILIDEIISFLLQALLSLKIGKVYKIPIIYRNR